MRTEDLAEAPTIRQILDGGAVLEAARIGGKRAKRMHKLLGVPIVTYRDGKVVVIPPADIEVDDDVERGGNSNAT